MPKLERIVLEGDMEKGINEAEKKLRLWLERNDIEILRWQIVTILSPYKISAYDIGFSWRSGVELFIEYKEK